VTNTDRIRDFLRSIAPANASNAEISARTGVKPHQQVFMITRSLADRGEIDGLRVGHKWRYSWPQGGSISDATLRASPVSPVAVGSWRATVADDPYPWDSDNPSESRLWVSWVPIGRLLFAGNSLEFPTVANEPGLYRFRVLNGGAESRYFGETENLARRFDSYRRPGPSQQTNLRLNAIFRAALSSGAEIAVAVVTKTAWIEVKGVRATADLSAKPTRCLFENWAIVEGRGESIESLNR
jgi:hypothetical protein